MTENSKIQWTDHTFNPWVGCTKISPGCDHCYAETWAKRAGDPQLWTGARRRTTKANWNQPLKWNAEAAAAGVRAKVFCASLADVFDNTVPEHWRWELFDLIWDTPHLDWQLLTKRIGNAHEMLNRAASFVFDALPGTRSWDLGGPWPNVWIGATVVNQEEADRDIPKLLAIPARVRFLSLEPLLGRVDLTRHLLANDLRKIDGGPGIDWAIVGGESGGHARPMSISWVVTILCNLFSAGVPAFLKQLGARVVWDDNHGPRPIHHSKGGDMAEWPEALRVREFPR